MVKSSSSSVLHNPHGSIGAPNNNITTTTTAIDIRKRQYKGVRMRRWGSWVSEIRAPNQKTRIWLGSYSTPEAAARAYDAAHLLLKGSSSASLNFPNSPPHHLPPTLMSPKSIQRVAAAAAAAANATTATTPSPPSPTPSPDILMDPIESWVDFGTFQSPKFMDQMLDHWAMFAPPQVEEIDDCEGDIPLWSFC